MFPYTRSKSNIVERKGYIPTRINDNNNKIRNSAFEILNSP